uniref:DNA-directed DNA polymerase n=1 Tax=Meloidogyne hapla TaxID=6305 RepID=A0A1I8B938_MELHA
MSAPPTKRAKLSSEQSRAFFIENILSSTIPSTTNLINLPQYGEGNLDKYITKLEHQVTHNKKFRYTKCHTKFQIKDVPTDPEGLLAGIFQHCIDAAIEECREKGNEPDHLGCIISSELLDPDVWIPIRQLNDNTIDSILNQFLKVGQSKKQQGVTLWGKPFDVIVTTLDMKNLPERQKIVGGRKTASTHHRINNQCLIKINNLDGKNHCLFFALQATLVNNIRELSRSQFYDYLHSRYGSRNKFKNETYQLMKEVGAVFGLKEYAAEDWVGPVVDYWNNKYSGNFIFKVFIFGSSGNYKPMYKYGPEIYDTPIIIYYDNKHFDGVQKCQDCCKTFEKPDCFLHHLNSGFCRNSKQCEKCGEIWNVYDNNKNGRRGHVCFEKYCGKCGDYHDPKRGCFIRPLKPKQQHPYRLVAFDLETMQHKLSNPAKQQRIHEPNFIAAKIVCPKCITTGEWKRSLKNYFCEVCGPHRTITFSQQPYNDTYSDQQIISQNPLDDFAQWILYDLPIKYDTYVYSHFGGRFDMVLVFEKLYNEKINPELIMKGNKLYEMKVKQRQNLNPNVIFRDSFNLMPMSLAALVPTFGLEVEDKPFFPHLANRPENYGRNICPTKEDYLADGMMPAKRREFDIWYEENRTTPFLLDEALASYCTNDVEILMCALIAFRSEFFETTKRKSHNGIDALRECMTIASACMKHYRTNHLEKEHLAIVPERGYENVDNQSLLALKFFQWYSEKNNVEIQTAHWKGEKVVGKYKLDGWIEEQQLGIEVNGCAWHIAIPVTTCFYLMD